MERLFADVLAGLGAGGIYVLLALGFNVTFATTRVLNFAHGEFLMLGTTVGFFFLAYFGWPVLPALALTILVAAVIGGLEERFAVRPATSKGLGATGWIISTLGVSILLRSGAALIMGAEPRVFPSFIPIQATSVFNVVLQPQELVITVVAVVATLLLALFYGRTAMGKALGAISQDTEAAALRGIPVGALSVVSFAIAGGLAALAGFLVAPLSGVYPTIGLLFTLKGFIASAVGGIPRIEGALAGGILIGLIEVFAADFVGTRYSNAAVFGLLLVILAVRPGGLLAPRNVRAV